MNIKQSAILEGLKAEMFFGKSLEEATRELLKTKRFNHLSVRRTAQMLTQDLSKLNKWSKALE